VIRWTYAFIDRPRPGFDEAAAFWTAVTRTRLSSLRGDDGEFATFIPDDGDACLKLQGVVEGGGAHLDLAYEHVEPQVGRIVALGARILVQSKGFAVLSSPAGLPFCLVTWVGEKSRPDVVTHPGGASSRVDQVCLDIGASEYGAEADFWQAVTGWERLRGSLPEFEVLKPAPSLPVRILLQRLGEDRPAGAHIDLACSDVEEVREVHEAHGARTVGRGAHWIVMTDPAGDVYCLTARDPRTGSLLVSS
jgi:Glyoxalase-like domain